MKIIGPFSGLAPLSAPKTLRKSIDLRIAIFERRASVFRLSILVASVFISTGVFVLSCVYAWNTALASGFEQFSSLIVSDSSAVLSLYKEFILSLLESVPVVAIMAVLIAGFIAGESIRRLVRVLGFTYAS